jgi:hypothetical protein
VLGNEIKMNEVVNMALKVLVGRFQGQRMVKALLKGWMKKNYEATLGYDFKSFMLIHD